MTYLLYLLLNEIISPELVEIIIYICIKTNMYVVI